MPASRGVNDPVARANERARSVPVLHQLLRNLLGEHDPAANELPVLMARRYLAEHGEDRSGRRFPELAVLLRGLVALGGTSAAFREAERWLEKHCRGCGTGLATKQNACPSCRTAWRELGAGARSVEESESQGEAA